MAKSHYEVLGLNSKCTAAEVRSAYRKIVLQHHPDRSQDPKSTDIFIRATEAYDVLSDFDRRRHYDALLEAERQAKLRPKPTSPPSGDVRGVSQRKKAQPHARSPSGAARTASIAAELNRLTLLFSRGRFAEAERLAREIIGADPRQAIPYAVLGDLARSRGNVKEAAKHYAFALQMDPRNEGYQRRHEELLEAFWPRHGSKPRASVEPNFAPPLVGIMLVGIACFYIVLSNERALFPSVPLISSWSLGLIVMLFLSGVCVGATFTLGRLFDRFSSSNINSLGRFSPSVALGTVAVVNFWAAVAMYSLLGLSQRAFSYTTSRLVSAVGATTVLMRLAAAASPNLNTVQVFLWGGNLVYLGALSGWMVADALQA
jgi:curved DNA-binding protein CbpA